MWQKHSKYVSEYVNNALYMGIMDRASLLKNTADFAQL